MIGVSTVILLYFVLLH